MNQVKVLVTAIYAWNEEVDRTPMWEARKKLAATIHTPWVVGGDFNTTLLQEERLKNNEVCENSTAELQQCVIDTGLSDLRFSGNFFTWSNRSQAG